MTTKIGEMLVGQEAYNYQTQSKYHFQWGQQFFAIFRFVAISAVTAWHAALYLSNFECIDFIMRALWYMVFIPFDLLEYGFAIKSEKATIAPDVSSVVRVGYAFGVFIIFNSADMFRANLGDSGKIVDGQLVVFSYFSEVSTYRWHIAICLCAVFRCLGGHRGYMKNWIVNSFKP